jgi:hypothetical protein
MEGFILVGFFILVIIAWIISSNNKEKMSNMLVKHDAPSISSLNSSISIANENHRNLEVMIAATETAKTAYEKELAKLKNEYDELCKECEWHLDNPPTMVSDERDDLNANLIKKKISAKAYSEKSAIIRKAFETSSDNHFAELDKKMQIQQDKHQEYLNHIQNRTTYINAITASIKSKEIMVKAVISAPSANIENTKVDFNTFDKYFGPRNESGIAIDRVNNQIALLTPNSRVIVRYADIVSSEMIVDSESIIKTDRVNQIGGAVVGGLLTGGIGALVMAMGASKKQLDKVNKIELKVLTMGTHNPIHTVLFYDKNSWGVPKSSLEVANKWYDFISVAIKESQIASQNISVKSNAATPTISLTDELLKLSELRSKGLLTDEEFTSAKKKLIV